MLARTIDGLARGLVWLACIVVFLMMAHVTLDVTLRFGFGRPLAGTLEIVSGYYMVLVIFLPLAYLARTDGHIVVELLTRRFKPRRLRLVAAGAAIITLAYMTTLAWMAGGEAVRRTREGEVWNIGFANMPIWPSRWILVAGTALMALAVAITIIELAWGKREVGDSYGDDTDHGDDRPLTP